MVLICIFRLEKPPYDQYICEPPEDDQRTTTPLIKFFTKALKFFSYFIFAGIVLGGALVSKVKITLINVQYKGNWNLEVNLSLWDSVLNIFEGVAS